MPSFRVRFGLQELLLVPAQDVLERWDRERATNFIQAGDIHPELAHQLIEGLINGSHVALRLDSQVRLLDEPVALPLRPGEPATPVVDEPKPTWISLEVAHSAGISTAGIQIAACDANGREHHGRLDANGYWRCDAVARGNCDVILLTPPVSLDGRIPPSSEPREPSVPAPRTVPLIRDTDGRWTASLRTESHSRLVIPSEQARCIQVTGMMFELEKSFLLPAGREALRLVLAAHVDHPDAEILVVGHTDTSGSSEFNDALSLDRARATAAFLRDDVDTWLGFYDHSDPDQRWGDREDRLMLASVRGPVGVPYLRAPLGVEQAWREFQEFAGLPPSGSPDQDSRHALVSAYLKLDGTSVSAQIPLTIHGCGEHFPARDVGNFKRLAENRRVELFIFPEGIAPRPPTESSRRRRGAHLRRQARLPSRKHWGHRQPRGGPARWSATLQQPYLSLAGRLSLMRARIAVVVLAIGGCTSSSDPAEHPLHAVEAVDQTAPPRDPRVEACQAAASTAALPGYSLFLQGARWSFADARLDPTVDEEPVAIWSDLLWFSSIVDEKTPQTPIPLGQPGPYDLRLTTDTTGVLLDDGSGERLVALAIRSDPTVAMPTDPSTVLAIDIEPSATPMDLGGFERLGTVVIAANRATGYGSQGGMTPEEMDAYRAELVRAWLRRLPTSVTTVWLRNVPPAVLDTVPGHVRYLGLQPDAQAEPAPVDLALIAAPSSLRIVRIEADPQRFPIEHRDALNRRDRAPTVLVNPPAPPRATFETMIACADRVQVRSTGACTDPDRTTTAVATITDSDAVAALRAWFVPSHTSGIRARPWCDSVALELYRGTNFLTSTFVDCNVMVTPYQRASRMIHGQAVCDWLRLETGRAFGRESDPRTDDAGR